MRIRTATAKELDAIAGPYRAELKIKKVKRAKKPKPVGERDLVNVLLRSLKINTPYPFYIFVDRDSGQERHTKSGWDFLLAARGLVRFVEAKKEMNSLTTFQQVTKREIEHAECKCLTLRFVNVRSLTDFDVLFEGGKVFRGTSIQVKDIFSV